jgi:hypothetical protein
VTDLLRRRAVHRMPARSLAVLAVASTSCALLAAPASAAPPERSTEVFPAAPVTVDHPFLDAACAALGIQVDADITFQTTERVTTFVDASGAPVRVHVQQSLDATIFDTARPQRTVDVQAVRNVTDDLVDGTVRLTGVRFKYSAQGEGTLFLTAGQVPIGPSGEPRGRDDFGDPEAFRPVCEYLAGG